jgi:hypothetical protein
LNHPFAIKLLPFGQFKAQFKIIDPASLTVCLAADKNPGLAFDQHNRAAR